MEKERRITYLRLLIEVVCTLCGIGLLIKVGPKVIDILLPFIIAFVLAWVFNPVLKVFQKHLKAARKPVSLILVILFYLVLLLLIIFASKVLLMQLGSLSRALPSMFSQLQSVYNQILDFIKDVLRLLPPEYVSVQAEVLNGIDQLWQTFRSFVYRSISNTAVFVSSFAMSLPNMVIFATVLVLASVIITADFPNLRENIYRILGRRGKHSVILMGRSFSSAVLGFFRSQLIFALIDMAIILVAFMLLKIPYPLPIALLLCVLDFIPFFGAGTVLVPWGGVCLALGLFQMGAGLLILYAVLYVFRRIFEPRILGGSTGFSSLQMLFSMYAGMKLFGISGLVFAPIAWITAANFLKTGILDGFFSDAAFVIGDIGKTIARPEPIRPREERNDNTNVTEPEGSSEANYDGKEKGR